MEKVFAYFTVVAAFGFWQSTQLIHAWKNLYQDEKKEKLEREAEIRRLREELQPQSKQNDRLP